MSIKRKVIRKKKRNEASEVLAKVSGAEELEIAANILRELAQRKQRKGKIEKLEEIKKNTPKKILTSEKDDYKLKRLKELEALQKTGILTKGEFKKLKKDLLK